MSTSGTPVKEEMARKKEKLEEMRRKKLEMQKLNMEKQKAKDTGAAGSAAGASGANPWSTADDIFKEFDIQGTTATPPTGATLDPSSAGAQTVPASTASGDGVLGSFSSGSPGLSRLSLNKAKLEMGNFSQVDIPPEELYLYPKSTQTDELIIPKELQPVEPEETPTSKVEESQKEKKQENEKQQEGSDGDSSQCLIPKELTEEEKNMIVESETFLTFLTRSSQFVERQITEPDHCKTYVKDEDDKSSSVQPGSQVKVSRVFYHDYWCANSLVSSLDWSPFFPTELILASYRNFNSNYHHSDVGGTVPSGGPDSDGLVLVWNLAFNTETPDNIYQCQSSVVNSVFAKFHQNLVVGGTYSGQVVIWDSRNNKRSPVQKTPLSAQAHTHPVFCTEVIGTENAHNLITISSDGKLCSWSMDMLSQPQETVELYAAASKASSKQTVAVKCMSFPTNEYNSFVVGSEDGYVYGAVRHGNKPGINDVYERHWAPVTSIDFNHCPGPIDFGHLFVTSSFDWSAKLWSTKSPGRALHSFEGLGEYVTGAQWCPTHPATFSTALSTGRLDIWNLNHDTEVPLSSLQLENSPAIIKSKWSANGKQVALGDDDGKIHIVHVGENICTPQQEAWSDLVQTLSELQNQTTEIDQFSDTGSNY